MSSPPDFPLERIRNFSIIAHIDHGKSTLADRILSKTGAVSDRESRDQFLDKMDLERERGITIKAQAVRLKYKAKDGQIYQLNLIDTPGHVDFTYEVSRSLAACEGALLVVDASQGVEAQTLANVYLAVDANLEIVPVINKVDLPSARPEEVKKEIEDIVGLDTSIAVLASAKTGLGIEEVLEAVVTYMPPPKGDAEAPLQALLIDSWFDPYRGVICLVRVKNGRIRLHEEIVFGQNREKKFEILEVGTFNPFAQVLDQLTPGEVGFFAASVKEVRDAKVGDTVVSAAHPHTDVLPGFRDVKPMVFAGFFPIQSSGYEALRDALEKLRLNDAAFSFEPESSQALGFGFRCGFLGLLHMNIVQERLEREFNAELITTSPTTIYLATMTDGAVVRIDNPAKLPAPEAYEKLEEPVVKVKLHTPTEYVGALIKLCEDRRGIQVGLEYISTTRVLITYEIPFAEVVYDFFDKMKSVSRGYASLDYELAGYKEAPLVRLDVLLNGDRVDALSIVVHKDRAYDRGKILTEKLRKIIPRQQFDVAIQAAIGSRIISRETVKAFRKDVTAKCYGGDISRKRKLLDRQKEGKKRMKQVGAVEVPQEAFLSVLKVDDE
ncbi:MAG: elongation factor 4 [Deltaproteobacteria bacterium]|jgi:GTP-binding protein LepA|nr:elongation factor 4 [Deltaproteobacteria bacterium]